MDTSPFAKRTDNSEFLRNHRGKNASLSEKIRRSKDAYYDFIISKTSEIPNDNIRRLPARYQGVTGSILYLTVFVVFISLFVTGINNDQGTIFLVPTTSDLTNYANFNPKPSVSAGVCEYINTVTTGSFVADFGGSWSTVKGYDSTSATFQLSLLSYNATFQEYKGTMDGVFDFLNNNIVPGFLSAAIEQQALYWLTYQQPFGEVPTNTVILVGDPAVIFESEVLVGYISNKNGVCYLPSVSSLDRAEMVAYLSFNNYSAYINNAACMDIINTSTILNYQPIANQNNLKLEIDVLTLLVAASVNARLILEGALNKLINTAVPIHVANISTPFAFGEVLYPRYPDMSPMACVIGLSNDDNDPVTCFVKFGNEYALPILYSKGSSETMPDACSCKMNANPSANPGSQYYTEECSQFQFIYGLLIMPNFDPITDYSVVIYNIAVGVLFNNTFFNASWLGSYWGVNTADSKYKSKQFAENAFSVCEQS